MFPLLESLSFFLGIFAMINPGCEPSECVMIGDAQYDIQAGKAVGTATIAVCTGTTLRKTFKTLQPNWIVKNVGDILPDIPLTVEKLKTKKLFN
jgi:phosphoglycolate phosphatase-like HAD superfamily hydrolase